MFSTNVHRSQFSQQSRQSSRREYACPKRVTVVTSIALDRLAVYRGLLVQETDFTHLDVMAGIDVIPRKG